MQSAHETAAALVAQMADEKPATSDSRGQRSESSKAAEYTRRVMARLWVRMSALFGRRWDTYAGEAGGGVFDEWCETLGSVPVDRIKRGLDVLQEEMPEWPPSLMDFMRMCSGRRKGDEGPVQTYSNRNFTEERIAAAKQGLLERKKQKLTPEQVMQRLAGIGGESQRESYERSGLHKRWGSLPPPGEWSREIRMAEEMEKRDG